MICLIHGTLSVSHHTYVLGEHQKRRDCFCLNTFCFGCSSFVFLLLERYVEWWLKVNIVTLSFFIMTAARQSQAAMFVCWCWPGREDVGCSRALGSGSVQTRWVLQHQTGQQISLWIWLWGQEHCHVEAGKRQTQTADTELEEVIVCCSIQISTHCDLRGTPD